VLDADGGIIWRHTADTRELSNKRDEFRSSVDGSLIEFGYFTVASQGWDSHRDRFAVAERKLTLDPALDATLKAPRTTGLNVANWTASEKPTLDGRALALEQFETSRSLTGVFRFLALPGR